MGINDSLEPFISYIEKDNKGIFVLVKTSNKGARDFQFIKDKGGNPLYEIVGERVEKLAFETKGEHGFSSIGAVVGATNSEGGYELRKKLSSAFLLIPGYGAQGGKAEDISEYFVDGNGAVVNSSRGILLAYKKQDKIGCSFGLCARNEAIRMRDDIKSFCREKK